MCANAGPAGYNYDETVSTLRYANRAKNIKNKPKINEDPKDAMLREYQEEVRGSEEQSESKSIIPHIHITSKLPLVASLLASPIIPTSFAIRFAHRRFRGSRLSSWAWTVREEGWLC